MSKLIDYKEEIHKCSKCGLCQSVCPVYKATGNDCAVSRGKFIMLNGIIKGDLTLNDKVNKYLDMCLKCNACKDFCPSGIDARKIFLTAKGEYFGKSVYSAFLKILNSPFIFNSFLNCINLAVNTYRFLQFGKLIKYFYPILNRTEFGKKIILANEFLTIQPSKHSTMQPQILSNASTLNVVYFKGCVNEYINPKVKNAVENILTQMGVKVIPSKFHCCGVPFLSSGNVEQFKRQAEFNLSQIPDDFDYFLTDCASCQNAFREYDNYIEDENLLNKLQKINQKSVNAVDFIVKNVNTFEFEKETSFTFHKPCHMENVDFLAEFLSKARNVNYIQMENFNECCGFSGEFALKNPEISQRISSTKAKNALSANADYILTSCPACILGLTQGLISNGSLSTPLSFLEFVLKARIDTY